MGQDQRCVHCQHVSKVPGSIISDISVDVKMYFKCIMLVYRAAVPQLHNTSVYSVLVMVRNAESVVMLSAVRGVDNMRKILNDWLSLNP